MTDQEILDRIKKVITTHVGIDGNDIKLETSFYDDLKADSLDILELILRFEEAFKIDMTDEAALELKTVQDMFKYVKSKLAEK